jgi:hypothetical protein
MRCAAERPANSATIHVTSRKRNCGGNGSSTGAAGGAALRAIVVIIKLTVVFVMALGIICAWSVAFAGNPVTLNVIAFAKPFAVGVTTIGIVAVAPALTVTGEAGPVSEYPSIVNGIDVGVGPPPGLGFTTVTLTVPAVATSAAGTAAVTCVELTSVVGSVLVPKFTAEVETKFVPLTVSVNAAPPATCVCPSDASVGTGLLTVKVRTIAGPVTGAGLLIETLNVPALAMSVVVIGAVSCELLTNVVVFCVPLNVIVAPFRKPLPLTVSVNAAPPARVLAGERETPVGCPLLMVNCAAGAEVPPPGAGFVTVTPTTPALAMSVVAMEAVS